MEPSIAIDIWSDIACPWCYIGKRHFEAGLESFAAQETAVPVEVVWHSFVLNPDAPVDFDGDNIDYVAKNKGQPREQVAERLAYVAEVARGVGLDFDYAALQPTNTVKAHQLLHYAKEHDVQDPTKELLLRAYFVDGQHIGRDEGLAELGTEVGLDRDDVLRSLREQEHLDAVRADIRQAAEYGINGVPFFVIESRYGISGAQPAENFTTALSQVLAERERTA